MSEIVVLQQEDKKGENYLRTVFNVVEQRLKKQEQINKYFFSDVVQNKQLSSSFIADVEKAKGLIIILSSMEEADLQAWVSHQKTVTGKIILPIIVNQEINFGIKTKYDLKLFVSCVGRFYFLDGIYVYDSNFLTPVKIEKEQERKINTELERFLAYMRAV